MLVAGMYKVDMPLSEKPAGEDCLQGITLILIQVINRQIIQQGEVRKLFCMDRSRYLNIMTVGIAATHKGESGQYGDIAPLPAAYLFDDIWDILYHRYKGKRLWGGIPDM